MARKRSYKLVKSSKEPFSILVAIGLFGLFFVSDFVYTLYIILVGREQALFASICNLVILALGFYGYHKFQRQPWYVIPMLIGGVVGTFMSIKLF